MSYKKKDISFLVTNSNIINNITGNGAIYTIIFNTKDYDTTNNFNIVTGEFTAPEDGVYFFTSAVQMTNLDSTVSDAILTILSNGNSFRLSRYNVGVIRLNNNFTAMVGSLQIKMLANQTAELQVQVTQASGLTVDISGNVRNCFFSGKKI